MTIGIENWRRTHGNDRTEHYAVNAHADMETWGIDEARLRELRAAWPHAALLTDVGMFTCHYPLWNIRRAHDGVGWITDFSGTEAHRYVCGAPTTDALSSYCDACETRLNVSVRASSRTRSQTRRRAHAVFAASRPTGQPGGGQEHAGGSSGANLSREKDAPEGDDG